VFVEHFPLPLPGPATLLPESVVTATTLNLFRCLLKLFLFEHCSLLPP